MILKILELFSGTESFSKVAKERGHEVFTIDNDEQFNPSLCIDIMELTPEMIPFKPDVIWASPPCQRFSVAALYRHWTDGKPSHDGTWESLMVVAKTISLILALKPKFWIIENPRGMLRKQSMMINLKRDTVTYCQYGHPCMKPTDLWNNLKKWKPKPMCKPGADCHERATRSSKNGTQGYINKYLDSKADPIHRAIVPRKLCLEIIKCCENTCSKS